MKRVLFILFMAVFATVTGYSQDTPLAPFYKQDEPQIVNEKIQPRDLPQSVKRALENTAYHGWIVNAAYKVPMTDPGNAGEEIGIMYEVELVNDRNEAKSIRFDKDGNQIIEKKNDNRNR